ncbi:MAG: cupin domain-containing protein [Actinomycetota bacterium]|nr:cupin domain-containing protein [Actinomycetota bacterium]
MVAPVELRAVKTAAPTAAREPFDHSSGGESAGRADRSALSRCIDLPGEEFAERYWGQQALFTPARPGRAPFTDLLDAHAVDQLVSRHGLRTPFLRMAKGGTVVPSRNFTRSGGTGAGIADQVADDKVLRALADGTTLVLQALHRTWPPLIHFATALAAELGHPVQINAYITPPQSQGFAAHYDNHDVFVLQVAGRKRWRIHSPVLRDPLPEQKWEQRKDEVEARSAEPPLIETVLEPGDALYLPRGFLHAAEALQELTIHLTVGVHPITRAALLRHLLTAVTVATDDPTLRQSLPMGRDLADRDVLGPHVERTARVLAGVLLDLARPHLDAVADAVGAELAADTRPEPISPLAQGTLAAILDDRTRLRVRSGLRYRLDEDHDELRLRVVDRVIALPVAAASAVKVVLDDEPFTPVELPGLDPAQRLALVRRLLGEGVVVPADDPA